ncbi:MAG: glycosyltransferase family 4 protein [Bacteroidales bacterium]|nr:glycosyltransferase family 4 protein [Bacteroidales bacterium]
MKIGIEGQRLFRATKHGMDFVALELIRNIQLLDQENEYVVFVKPGEDKCLESTTNVKIIELEGGPFPLWEQIALPKAVKAYGCDLIHCTSNTAPNFGSTPLILTLHDIFFLETFSLFTKSYSLYQRFGNTYRRYIVPDLVKKAKRIITVSKSEKSRIVDFFHMDEKKVKVIYNGVSEKFRIPVSEEEKIRVKREYSLPDNYLLHLGNTDPKKNTERVLTAYIQYLDICKHKIPLVLVDYPELLTHKLLHHLGRMDVKDYIHRLDYVVNKDLPAMYTMAELFLYPSLRESFGIPLLEAMCCGTAVISSDVFAMPEVAEDAAYLIDPSKPESISSAMRDLIAHPEMRQSYIEKGKLQSTKYSWKKMATQVMELYKEVIAEVKT